MDMRLSIGNRVFPISHNQFQSIVASFKEACEASFGTSCSLRIKALTQTKLSSTFWLDESTMSHLREVNQRATFFKTDDLPLVTPEIFKAAAYLDVVIRPTEWGTTPDYAFACVEFKGNLARRATFYIQPGDANLVRALKEQHRSMVLTDGYDSHCDLG